MRVAAAARAWSWWWLSRNAPGTLALNVYREANKNVFQFSVTDRDGIQSLTAATVTARDGQTASVLGDFSRDDANTFSGSDQRNNNRWRRGTMAVTYIETATGKSRTVTGAWDV